MDCSLPESSVLGILQARILEWVAKPSSRGSSQPRDWSNLHLLCLLHWQVGSLGYQDTIILQQKHKSCSGKQQVQVISVIMLDLLLGHILNILWILVFIWVQTGEHHLGLFCTRAWSSFPGVDLELLFPGLALLLPQTLQVHCWPALGRNLPLFLGDTPVTCLSGTQRWPAELVTVRWLRSQFGHRDRCSFKKSFISKIQC